MEKKYLITMVVLNLVFYILGISFISSQLYYQKFWSSRLWIGTNILIGFISIGIIIGWYLMKKNPKDKYIKAGFIINIATFIIYVLYSLIFIGLEPAIFQ